MNIPKCILNTGVRSVLAFFPRQRSFLLLLTLAFALSLAAGCAKPRPKPIDGGKASRSAITQTALSAIGTRYKSGGTSPSSGFDCSGLISWTFSQHGIDLPRTAKEQMQAGKRVAKNQLKPGDLVIFKISGRRGYHSGIYTGDGKFIHSPRTGQRVRLDNVDDKYWKKRFISGRRVPQLD